MRRVHDEQEMTGGQAIDEQIIDEGPSRGHQPGILRLADLQLGRVVTRNALHGRQRVRAGDLDLAHVADVEQPRALADSQVLGGDAGVLDRHVPPAKRDHSGARSAMESVERRLLERSGGSLFHGRAVTRSVFDRNR